MRNMSFFLTQQQFLDRIKDVTRRLGWMTLLPGQYFTAVEKAQGLRKGEHIKVLGQCQCISNHPERLADIIKRPIRSDQNGDSNNLWSMRSECEREGFQNLTPKEFVTFFCSEMKCQPTTTVNRIVFKRLD